MLFIVLDPHGLGWLVLPLAVAVFVGLFLVRLVRSYRARLVGGREGRWIDAILDDDARPRAIDEVRAALERLDGSSPRGRREDVHLRVLLGQLLDASEQYEAAREALQRPNKGALPPLERALLLHAEAVVVLRQGDPEAVLALLTGRRPSGEPELDLRLDLLEASAQLEVGQVEAALETSTRARKTVGNDPALLLEARVVRAAALDALGQTDDAIAIVRGFGPDVIAMLRRLGQPRVRSLAVAAADLSPETATS